MSYEQFEYKGTLLNLLGFDAFYHILILRTFHAVIIEAK